MDRAEHLKASLKGPVAAAGGQMMGGSGGGAKSHGADVQRLREQLGSSILVERPRVRWEDVAGLELAKEALQEAVVLPVRYPQLFTGARTPWRGILLYGPPGTGKSHLAKAVASQVQSTFFSVSSSDLVSKWVGESEKLVRNLFEMAAEHKPAIIFIDEIDALCGERGDGESEGSRRLKNEFLVRMQGTGTSADEGVLVLGATNLPWALDPALRRRFERRIYIPLPDRAARARMVAIHVGDTPHALAPADLAKIGELTQGFSGSDVAVLVRDALMEPVRALQAATHFRPVGGKFVACSPGHPEAREMTLADVDPDKVMPADVTMNDFRKALRNAKPTVSASDLKRYEQFTKDFGQEAQ
mmetsp:Transcript_27287/g.91292  ORF Transcript_27287/g.91292 Transcript_27287/m.91292 type:complete len:358 (+) Transcript_27287:345-1418(+)